MTYSILGLCKTKFYVSCAQAERHSCILFLVAMGRWVWEISFGVILMGYVLFIICIPRSAFRAETTGSTTLCLLFILQYPSFQGLLPSSPPPHDTRDISSPLHQGESCMMKQRTNCIHNAYFAPSFIRLTAS